MTRMQTTSLEAFNALRPELNNREKQVLECMDRMQRPVCDRDLATALNWEINQVNGRRNALMKKGAIEQAYKKHSYITGRTVIYWKLVPKQGSLFDEATDVA